MSHDRETFIAQSLLGTAMVFGALVWVSGWTPVRGPQAVWIAVAFLCAVGIAGLAANELFESASRRQAKRWRKLRVSLSDLSEPSSFLKAKYGSEVAEAIERIRS